MSVKSITSVPENLVSIEITQESDISSLGTTYSLGSTARVIGQISAEYVLTADGWVKTSGGSLPGVTAADNGKVLGVVNGEWDKVAAGGGGGSSDFFPVYFYSASGQLTGASKTYAEVTEAINAGKIVYAQIVSYDHGQDPVTEGVLDPFRYWYVGNSNNYASYGQPGSSQYMFMAIVPSASTYSDPDVFSNPLSEDHIMYFYRDDGTILYLYKNVTYSNT